MDNEKPNKLKNGLQPRHAVIAAVISGVLGGSSAPFAWVKLGGPNPFRSDPFTGAQAQALERRIGSVERIVESHLGPNHPDVTGSFDKRIGQLETSVELILINQQRILDRLDRR